MCDIVHDVAPLEKLLRNIHDVVLVVCRVVTVAAATELVPMVLVQQMTPGWGAS